MRRESATKQQDWPDKHGRVQNYILDFKKIVALESSKTKMVSV